MDTNNYINFFRDNTDTLWDWKNLEKKYAEYGFYYLSVLLKTISNNVVFYFFIISCITIFPLLKSLGQFSIYPILGLIVYFARFFPVRNMNQIRGSLAIAIVIYAIRYLVQNKPRKYTILVLFAMMFHYSMAVALIFRFIYRIKISLKSTVVLLLVSIVLSIYIGKIFSSLFLNYYKVFAFLGYIGYEDLGIFNPVIYFQILLCLLFFCFEKSLIKVQKGYYIIRNAYLFSTLILILTCNLGVIGGRLATVFATCEIFIVPALVSVVRPRIIGYIIMIVMITVIFYLNFNKMLLDSYAWAYKLAI
jgi:hypothetical protein